MGDYPGERLVDFVRDGGYQFSHGHHSCDMREVRLRLAPCFFGLFAIFNVDHDSIPLENTSSLVPHWHGTHQEPVICPVGAMEPRFILQRLADGHRHPPFLENPLEVIRMNASLPAEACRMLYA